MTMAAATMASTEDVSSFIVGGVDATVAEHPYMAGIFNFGLHSCGGSILSASNVLTVKIRDNFTIDVFCLVNTLIVGVFFVNH